MRRVFALMTVLGTGACAMIAGIDGLEVGERQGAALPERDGGESGEGEDSGEPSGTDASPNPTDATTTKDVIADTPPPVCTLPTNDNFAKPVNAKWAVRG